MNMDWDRNANPAGLDQTASVLMGGRGSGLETPFAEARPDVSESNQLNRLGDALDAVQPQLPGADPDEVKRKVLEGARSGLAKLNQGEPPERFTFGEHIGLEAVILTGGERPSLIVKGGFVDLGAPDLGDWHGKLRRFEPQIRKLIASVGRIDIPVTPNFAGTCFLIADGLAVTNRHVAELIGTQDAAGGWTLRWPDQTAVTFGGEEGGGPGPTCKVAGIAYAGPDAINRNIDFTHLDMAVLQLADRRASPLPDPVTFEVDTKQPTSERDIYLVGFPAEPFQWLFGGKPPAGFETTEVISGVFNSKFGIKRLAPGKVIFGPGGLPNDPKGWICAHDASTLGGNSGSCIADLGQDGFRVMGLHFGGVARGQNWGHAVAKLHGQLAAFPARFVA